jgi:hypothetical protein
MTSIDQLILGPPDDTPILPYYRGVFSHAFVALHPFFTIDGVHPRQCEYGTLVVEGSDAPADLGFVEWNDREAAARRAGKDMMVEEVELAAKQRGNRVGWQSMGFPDHCELDRALRTSIHGLNNKFSDNRAAENLAAFCFQQGVFPPTEGSFQPLMHRNLANLFKTAGFTSLIAGDEFGDDERLIDIALLEQDSLWLGHPDLPKYGVKRLIAPDRSLLAWVHWDSFYTLLLGTVDTLKNQRPCTSFEGFWCSEGTTTYWLQQPPLPLAR